MDFSDRVILITGSSSSIGFAAASGFLEAGGRVMINASNQGHVNSALKRLARFGDRVAGHRADVRYAEEVAGLVEATVGRFGGLDILVNAAGVTTSAPLIELPEDVWDLTMDVNLKGPFLVSKAAVRVMLARGRGGRIVNVASAAGLSTRPGAGHYAASKAGLIMLTKTFALELGSSGIAVNAVAPGLVIAEDKEKKVAPGFAQAFARSVPLGRVADPSDIADVVLFLCSNEARYISGEVITVDGGALAGRYSLPETY